MKKLNFFLVNLVIIFAWVNFSFSKNIRFVLALVQTIFFVVWGWDNHRENKGLNKKSLLEYLILGFIALALLSFLIYYD